MGAPVFHMLQLLVVFLQFAYIWQDKGIKYSAQGESYIFIQQYNKCYN